jgi:hypothetical protein
MKQPYLRLLAAFCVLGAFLNFVVVTDQGGEETLSINSGKRRQLRGSVGSVVASSTAPRRRRRLVESEPVRFAWGIISHPDDDAIRQVLRQTYLASDPRICVLEDTEALPTDCQIAYTFILPSSLIEDYGSSAPIVFEDAKDITYLPETRTNSLLAMWFRHASRADVDYVAKVDATTLLFPGQFLAATEDMLASPNLHRVIGGLPRDRWDCGGFSKWKCRQMVARTFMSTELYFMSTDLAAFVPMDISDDDPVRLANWLSSSFPQLPTMQVTMQPSHGLWEYQPPNSSSSQLLERWEYLKSQQFSRQLLRSNEGPSPRWEGTSLVDEFYRRIPWKLFPDSLTRFNLP